VTNYRNPRNSPPISQNPHAKKRNPTPATKSTARPRKSNYRNPPALDREPRFLNVVANTWLGTRWPLTYTLSSGRHNVQTTEPTAFTKDVWSDSALEVLHIMRYINLLTYLLTDDPALGHRLSKRGISLPPSSCNASDVCATTGRDNVVQPFLNTLRPMLVDFDN